MQDNIPRFAVKCPAHIQPYEPNWSHIQYAFYGITLRDASTDTITVDTAVALIVTKMNAATVLHHILQRDHPSELMFAYNEEFTIALCRAFLRTPYEYLCEMAHREYIKHA